MRKIFLDTEFTGLHQSTTLISLALVSENNETFYAEFNDYDTTQVDDWIQENVINNLKYHNIKKLYSENETSVEIKDCKKEIAYQIVRWLKNLTNRKYTDFTHPLYEIYSDTLAYDWVLFNQLWNNALNLPKLIYYIPQDLSSYFNCLNIDPDINREEFAGIFDFQKHSALSDALVIKACFDKIFNAQ